MNTHRCRLTIEVEFVDRLGYIDGYGEFLRYANHIGQTISERKDVTYCGVSDIKLYDKESLPPDSFFDRANYSTDEDEPTLRESLAKRALMAMGREDLMPFSQGDGYYGPESYVAELLKIQPQVDWNSLMTQYGSSL